LILQRAASLAVGGAILGVRATIRIERLHFDRHEALTRRGVPFEIGRASCRERV